MKTKTRKVRCDAINKNHKRKFASLEQRNLSEMTREEYEFRFQKALNDIAKYYSIWEVEELVNNRKLKN